MFEHLLGSLLELTPAVHIANLLGGGGTGPVLSGVAFRRRLLLIGNHALSVLLVSSSSVSLISGGSSRRCLRLFADDIEHTVLERLFIFTEPVLLPGVVEDVSGHLVALHATLEELHTSSVVWLLFELKGAAVLHKFTEFAGMASAKLLKRRLNLLLLDVVILLVLGATW